MKLKEDYFFTVINDTGRTIDFKSWVRKADKFEENLNALGEKVKKRINVNQFKSVMSRRVRGFWRQNYDAHYEWDIKKGKGSSATGLSASRRKEYLKDRGASFDLAPGGTGKGIVSTNIFGIRTGNLKRTITSRKGSEVSVRSYHESKRSYVLGVAVELRPEVFRSSSNKVTYGQYSHKVSTGNYFDHFNDRVTSMDSDASSVFVVLSPSQLRKIRLGINKGYGVAMQELVLQEKTKLSQ